MAQTYALDTGLHKMLPRIGLIVFGLGFLSILDRANVAYAALKMNQDLGFSDATYAFGSGMFFIGYFLFEVPSNLLLVRIGARKWIARICLTWGVIAGLMVLTRGVVSFAILRFLLGLAEAGLFPGVYFLLAAWFPIKQRALATSLFVAAEPVALIVAGPISGWLVGTNGFFGLAGWQVVFLVEAIPTVLYTFVVLRWLPDSPQNVKWLTKAEKEAVAAQLATEQPFDPNGETATLRTALRMPAVWALTAIYFCVACASYGLNFFGPLIIQSFTGLGGLGVGLLSALPYIGALIFMTLVARHSDRTGERRKHFTAAMLVAFIGLMVAGLTLSTPVAAMAGLVVLGMGIYAAFPTFWGQPANILAGTAAAGGFAIINSVGNLGGFVGPYVVGALKDAFDSYVGGLLFLATLMIIAAAGCFFGMRTRRLPPVRSEPGTVR